MTRQISHRSSALAARYRYSVDYRFTTGLYEARVDRAPAGMPPFAFVATSTTDADARREVAFMVASALQSSRARED